MSRARGLVVLALVLFGVLHVGVHRRVRALADDGVRELEGSALPELRVRDATTGEVVGLASRIGRGPVTIVNFWATWCQPCVLELPELERWHRDRDVPVVSIHVGDPGALRSFLAERRLAFPVFEGDAEAIAPSISLSRLPMTIYVGPDRDILGVHAGALDDRQASRIERWLER